MAGLTRRIHGATMIEGQCEFCGRWCNSGVEWNRQAKRRTICICDECIVKDVLPDVIREAIVSALDSTDGLEELVGPVFTELQELLWLIREIAAERKQASEHRAIARLEDGDQR